jgi:hypothetical protein
MRIGRILARTLIVLPLGCAALPAEAACDMPDVPPIDVPAGTLKDGAQLHIVSGAVGLCDAASREIAVDLPNLHGIRDAKVRVALGGFIRKYGVHQIGFTLQGEAADVTPTGVKIRFSALIDGLERYQLAYTLFVVMPAQP